MGSQSVINRCNKSHYIADLGGHTSNNLAEIQNPNFSIFFPSVY